MAYDARAVANYFLKLAKSEGRFLDPMGIQKLVYFAHGWHLAILGAPLVNQAIEAWDYGPVIPDIYHAFKEFGSGWISRPALVLSPGSRTVYEWLDPQIPNTPENERTLALLRRVWETYKGYTSVQLSNLTHTNNSPWTLARNREQMVIANPDIAEYFRTLARQNAASSSG